MKTLGIEIISDSPCWIVLNGNNTSGTLETIEPSRHKFPSSEEDEVSNLLQLKELVINILRQNNIENVGLLRAGIGCKPIRCKVEFIIQYACKELGIPCELIAPQTIAAAEKRKIHQVTGASLIEVFNGGNKISPKYLEKAAYCAWSVLNAHSNAAS